jgi:hypothetical protein
MEATQEVFGKIYRPFSEVMPQMGIVGGES